MATHTRYSSGMLAFALVVFAATASAQSPGGQAPGERQGRAVASMAKASPAERGQLTRQFVNKWGNYVQRVYQVPVGTWSKRMVSNFVSADASNFRNALKRDTFEGAMAELTGTGHRLSDEAVIAKLASMDAGSSRSRVTVKTLGNVGNDLVYTPLQPCRIVDTRNTSAGAIPANSTRSFDALTSVNFTGQGGSSTNCGTSGLSVTAVVINLTAVTPVANGYATVYPFGTSQPLSSNVNYYTGITAANGVIAQIPNPLSSSDFTIYSNAQSHYVVDILGYFAPPVATALQCIDTVNVSTPSPGVVPGGTRNELALDCPAGYTQTATNCETTSWLMPIVFFHDGTCSARNNDSSNQFLRASRTCCRVPGR